VASAVRWFHKYNNDTLSNNKRPSFAQSLALFKMNEGLVESVRIASVAEGLGMLGALAMLHYVVSSAGLKKEVERFLIALSTDTDKTEGDPVLLLRRRLLDQQKDKAKLQPHEQLALIIKAWNHWLNGDSIKFLRWRGVGPTPEPFPVIQTTLD
jgi:hypothetical protein